jgi:hypothetical protein
MGGGCCGCLVLLVGIGAAGTIFGTAALAPDQAEQDAQYRQGREDAAAFQDRPIDECFEAAVQRAAVCDPLALVSCIRRPEGMFAQCMITARPDPTFCERYQRPEHCTRACQRHGGGFRCDFFCGVIDNSVARACAASR